MLGDLRENYIDIKKCKNALVFFDGFDELLDSSPNLKISEFVLGPILRFVKASKAQIVITTRRMSIEREFNYRNRINEIEQCSTFEILPMTFNQQVDWIQTYISHCETKANSMQNSNKHWADKAIKLHKYLEEFKEGAPCRVESKKEEKDILSIPLLFRIIVEFQIDPNQSIGSAKLYDELFDLTWDRRPKQLSRNDLINTKKHTLELLSEHAMKCFENDTDSVLTDVEIKGAISFWTYQFYTKRINDSGILDTYMGEYSKKIRVGFLHRSFYQYFVAKRIIMLLLEPIGDKAEILCKFLARLTRKIFDDSIIDNVGILFNKLDKCEQNKFKNNLQIVYDIITKTDAILPETNAMTWVRSIGNASGESPLEAANILFRNVGLICSSCNQYKLFDKIKNCSSLALSIFSLEGIDLSFCGFQSINFSYANLSGADLTSFRCGCALFKKANLLGTKFRQAYLPEANFEGADLTGANFIYAKLENANFEGADLTNANFSGAVLTNANLKGATLKGTKFDTASLKYANLDGAIIINANFNAAELFSARLDKAILVNVNMSYSSQDLANYKDAYLVDINFSGVNLENVHLEEVKSIVVNKDTNNIGVAGLLKRIIGNN